MGRGKRNIQRQEKMEKYGAQLHTNFNTLRGRRILGLSN